MFGSDPLPCPAPGVQKIAITGGMSTDPERGFFVVGSQHPYTYYQYVFEYPNIPQEEAFTIRAILRQHRGITTFSYTPVGFDGPSATPREVCIVPPVITPQRIGPGSYRLSFTAEEQLDPNT